MVDGGWFKTSKEVKSSKKSFNLGVGFRSLSRHSNSKPGQVIKMRQRHIPHSSDLPGHLNNFHGASKGPLTTLCEAWG